jgi:hypothetical protein
MYVILHRVRYSMYVVLHRVRYRMYVVLHRVRYQMYVVMSHRVRYHMYVVLPGALCLYPLPFVRHSYSAVECTQFNSPVLYSQFVSHSKHSCAASPAA